MRSQRSAGRKRFAAVLAVSRRSRARSPASGSGGESGSPGSSSSFRHSSVTRNIEAANTGPRKIQHDPNHSANEIVAAFAASLAKTDGPLRYALDANVPRQPVICRQFAILSERAGGIRPRSGSRPDGQGRMAKRPQTFTHTINNGMSGPQRRTILCCGLGTFLLHRP